MKRGMILGVSLGFLLCAVVAWQFSWLGAGLGDVINHGANEDWDWQLSLYEVSRISLWEYGQLPAWNPYVQGGVPLLANPESPFFYPPFLLVLAFGTSAGLKLWVLLHLWLLIWACWWAGREMGLGPVAAHGAGLFTLGSAFVPGFIAVGHIMYLPLGWLPLAWVAQRRGHWHLSGACLAATLLAGGHYLLLYGALWLTLDALLRSLDSARLAWLAPVLVLNGLLLGQAWAAWPIGLALLVVISLQRTRDTRPLRQLLWAGLTAALLLGVKLMTAPALFARAERLESQGVMSIADPYTPILAWEVMSGAVERLSGHEGQNVFWSAVPVLLGLVGLAWAGWRRPRWGILGLLWWNLGWGGSTPVNFLEFFHRLPGLDYIRVVERYSLVWTLFLGWGAGWLWGVASRRSRVLGGGVLLALGWWLVQSIPQAAGMQRMGPGRDLDRVPSEFQQADEENLPGLSNYESIQAGRGRIDFWTTAWLSDPSEALSAPGREGYKGEAWRADDGTGIPLEFSPSALELTLTRAGQVVFNQNAFVGWEVEGREAGEVDGLLSVYLEPGTHRLVYRPPGLLPGLGLSVLGLLVLVGRGRWRAGGPRSSGSERRSERSRDPPATG